MGRKPLSGRTIVVTRPREQARELSRALAAAGAKVVLAPAIRVAAPSSYAPLDAALRALSRFDCLVFTSRNAVDRFFARHRALGLRKPARPPRLFAVGPSTAKRLARRGWGLAETAERSDGASLALALAPARGRRVLIPRAQQGREELPRILRRRGARVSVVEAYRTVADERGAEAVRRLARDGGVDAVLFLSPSAVAQFTRQLGRRESLALFRRAIAASIGPTTSRALRARGLKVGAQAREQSVPALVAALGEALG